MKEDDIYDDEAVFEAVTKEEFFAEEQEMIPDDPPHEPVEVDALNGFVEEVNSQRDKDVIHHDTVLIPRYLHIFHDK